MTLTSGSTESAARGAPSGAALGTLGVVGSGIMGRGIVEVAALGGYEVVLRSRELNTAEKSIGSVAGRLAARAERKKLSTAEHDACVGRLSATDDLSALSDCDLVIETVVEDLSTKRRLFAELDRVCRPGALLASNTSTLPVIDLAMETGRPEKVCGVHFFNPVPTMPLVEVVRPITASNETIEAVMEFAKALGKRPVVVSDQAGFVVNALLFPYLNNAVRLFGNGVASMEDIDEAMRGGCGFPMGPFALLDLVGLDTAVSILEALYEEYREPNYAPVPLIRRMVAAGQLGRKSGSGFYEYAPT